MYVPSKELAKLFETFHYEPMIRKPFGSWLEKFENLRSLEPGSRCNSLLHQVYIPHPT